MMCPRCNAEIEETTEPVGPVVIKGRSIRVPYKRYEHCGLVWATDAQRKENNRILMKARYAPKML